MLEPITFNRSEVSTYCSVRMPNINQTGAGEWRGPCPIHKGKNDSFAIDSETGRAFCHSKCGRGWSLLQLEQELTKSGFKAALATVFQLVGRDQPLVRPPHHRTNGSPADAKPSKPTKHCPPSCKWREMERYPYVDQRGELLFEVVRYVKPDGAKTFLQCRPSGSDAAGTSTEGVPAGGVVFGLGAGPYVRDERSENAGGKAKWRQAPAGLAKRIYEFRECPRVPYRLPRVLQSEEVYLVEGEKDVHTLESWSLTASCNPGGAGNSRLYKEWGQYLRGRRIIIVPDNDDDGRRHAGAIATTLLPVARSIQIVELPGLAEKGDISDWQGAGGTREQFDELVKSAPALDSSTLADLLRRWGVADAGMQHRASASDTWPQPAPLQSELPPVQPFDEEVLPFSLRPLVRDIAHRMQVPKDYPAIAMVLCLAGAVNRRAHIQPKANDTGWRVVPNLWGGIIAPPGFMKSPVIQATMRPLRAIENEWRDDYDAAMQTFNQAMEQSEIERAAWREQYKSAIKRQKTPPERPSDAPLEPTLRRLIVNDATFEALHETLSGNPEGLLVSRDELTGWLSNLDRPGREGERAFYLEAWNGDTGFTIDRIGRGTIHVPECCISMLGGIQPGRLRSYLTDALRDGPSNDGLIQRFQLLVWPDTEPGWQYVDRLPDEASEQQAARVFRKLVLELDPSSPAFRFSPDAQQLFVQWMGDLEVKIRTDELHPALISHLSKYRKLMPSLALLFELADWAAGQCDGSAVTLQHAKQSAEFCDYLESQARRVYSCLTTPQLRAARELAEKIRNRKTGADGSFSTRDVYLKGWSGLDSPEAVKQAADVLEDAGWIRATRSEPTPQGGRPASRYDINPRVWA